jgi:hypothetical protein
MKEDCRHGLAKKDIARILNSKEELPNTNNHKKQMNS